MLLHEKLQTLCITEKITLGLAESCTGGAMAARITSQEGASQYFKGSIVSYSNDVKTNILGVTPKLIEEHSAVSKIVTLKMLEGLFLCLQPSLGLAITGIAGPSGGTPKTPIGTVYIALGWKDRPAQEFALKLEGARKDIIDLAVDKGLQYLINFIENNPRK